MSVRILGRLPRFLKNGRVVCRSSSMQDGLKYEVAQFQYSQLIRTRELWRGITSTLGSQRCLSSNASEILDPLEYEKLSEETLEELTDYLENCFEDINLKELDINFNSGVLTIVLGKELGTYVINKQAPNKQIWLSSPTSGPKRYDFVDGQWTYGHDGSIMHDLVETELSKALNYEFDLKSLLYYKFLKDQDS